jgi:hypothetical protein
MTVTLNLKPEIEAQLLAQARASGMAVEEYLLSVVERVILPATHEAMSAEERASAFEAWATGQRTSSQLSDYAVSRDGIYEGRDH